MCIKANVVGAFSLGYPHITLALQFTIHVILTDYHWVNRHLALVLVLEGAQIVFRIICLTCYGKLGWQCFPQKINLVKLGFTLYTCLQRCSNSSRNSSVKLALGNSKWFNFFHDWTLKLNIFNLPLSNISLWQMFQQSCDVSH